MPDRLRISLKATPALTVNKIAIGGLKLVYIACANKTIRYNKGSSPIVYIGTTKNGISRVAGSAAYRSEDIFAEHGITSFEIRIVTCGVRQNVRTWRKLERALLLGFKEKYGQQPLCNVQGKGMTEGNEFGMFSRGRIMSILKTLAERGEARGRPISK